MVILNEVRGAPVVRDGDTDHCDGAEIVQQVFESVIEWIH